MWYFVYSWRHAFLVFFPAAFILPSVYAYTVVRRHYFLACLLMGRCMSAAPYYYQCWQGMVVRCVFRLWLSGAPSYYILFLRGQYFSAAPYSLFIVGWRQSAAPYLYVYPLCYTHEGFLLQIW